MSDWISSVSTAVVAVAGIAATYLTSAKGRDQAERLARDKTEHDRQLVEDERNQQRRSEAYVELLTYVELVGTAIRRIVPGASVSDLGNLEPADESVARAQALLGAYGSAASIAYFEVWQQTTPPIVSELLYLSAKGQSESQEQGTLVLSTSRDDGVTAAWRKMQEVKQREEQARRELADQLSAELLGTRRFNVKVEERFTIGAQSQPE
ncbi:hypothetical protein [Actinoplanes sp. NPDC051411]|uniref:hypothetical protein n=1 Tax=Actinoplanes sp. NPDC051411 TaxID=3155522 RepID=UPI0034399EF8